MATEDLIVRASLRDELSQPIRRVRGEVDETRRAVDRLDRSGRRSGGPLNGVDRSGGRAQRTLANTHRRLSALSTELGGRFARFARAGAVALGALAAAATGFGLRTAAGLETSQVQLETLVGSATRARALMEDLYALDPKVPFSASELQRTAAALLNFGFTADNVLGTVQGISDLAASTSDPGAALERVARAVGQINASGFVRAEELNQLIDAGVAVGPALEAAFGDTLGNIRNRMERGEDLPAGSFLAELMAGRAGVAEKVATTTLTGLMSSVRSRVERGLSGAAAPLVESMKEALPAIEEGVGALVSQIAPPLVRVGTAILNMLVAALPVLAPLLATLADGVVSLLNAAAPGFEALRPVMADLNGALGELVAALVDVMPELVAAFVALVGVLPDFVRLLSALVPLVGPLARLVAGLLEAEPLRGIFAGLLVALLGYRALAGIVGTLHAFAGGIAAIGAAQAGAGGMGGVPTVAGAPGRPGAGVPAMAGVGRFLGPAMLGVGGAVGMYGSIAEGGRNGASVGGALSGAASGAMVGAALGSVLPGVGTLIGAGAGGIVGAGAHLLSGLLGGGKKKGPSAEERALARAARQAELDVGNAQRRAAAGLPPLGTTATAAGFDTAGPTRVESSTTVAPGAIVVYPQSDLDLQRSITRGIETYERDRAERGGR